MAAEGDVDHLRTATDSEDRQPRRKGCLEEMQFQPIPLRIDSHVGKHLPAIDLGADVVAAADDEARERFGEEEDRRS